MNCLICGEEGVIKYKNLKDGLVDSSFVYNVKWCKNDNVLWEDNSLTDFDYSSIYKNYPSHKKQKNKKMFFEILTNFLNFDVISFILKNKNSRVLDFGCGGGSLISALKEMKYDVFGVEKDIDLVNILKKEFGADKIKNFDNFNELEKNSFDIIVLSHVIEHLDDPIKSLTVLCSLLKNNGFILISTPNIDSLGHSFFKGNWRGLEVPRHRFVFSEKSLEAIINKCGAKSEKKFFPVGLARGIFVSSLSNYEQNKNNIFIKYFFHFIGFCFMIFEYLLVKIGFKNLSEEIVIIAKKLK